MHEKNVTNIVTIWREHSLGLSWVCGPDRAIKITETWSHLQHAMTRLPASEQTKSGREGCHPQLPWYKICLHFMDTLKSNCAGSTTSYWKCQEIQATPLQPREARIFFSYSSKSCRASPTIVSCAHGLSDKPNYITMGPEHKNTTQLVSRRSKKHALQA